VPYKGTVHRIVERVLNDGISAGQKMFKCYVLNNISYQRNTYLLGLCPSKIKRHTKFHPLELEARRWLKQVLSGIGNQCILCSSTSALCGPGSLFSIATDYELDCPGIESWWGRDFLPIQTGPGAHPASCIMGTGSFPG